MNEFCVFTIVKDEHKFLDEWINYHLSIGAIQVFIFEDMNSQSHYNICSKYDSSIVHLLNIKDVILNDVNVHTSNRQHIYLNSILKYIIAHNDIHWAAYIDVDEFVTLERGKNIYDILNLYNEYDMVLIQMKFYNANNHIYSPGGNVLDNYKKSIPSKLATCSASKDNTKIIFNLKRWNCETMKSCQHFPLTRCKWCKTDFSQNNYKDIYNNIYVRHYITKSFEDYCDKIFVRGQFFNSKKLRYFFTTNPEIFMDNHEVVKLLNTYYNKFLNGDIQLNVWWQ